MIDGPQAPPLDENAVRIAELERRLARIEERLQLGNEPRANGGAESLMQGGRSNGTNEELAAAHGSAGDILPAFFAHGKDARVTTNQDALEFELGQNWFARIGILALAAGAGFLLLLPHAGMPPAVPSLLGLAGAAMLFGLTRISAGPFELVSRYLRGAGMALLYCSVVRLFYFGVTPALSASGLWGRALLVAAVVANLAIALRRGSPWLTALALLTGYATVLAAGPGWFALAGLLGVTGAAALCGEKYRWPAIQVSAPVLTFVTYIGWAVLHASAEGGRLSVEPAVAPWFVLGALLILAGVPLFRATPASDSLLANGTALLTCGFGYAAFLLHTFATFGPAFALAHGAASMLLLGIALAYWIRCHTYGATFFYAMTGYVALSVAILQAAAMPNVFVWLSLQSLLVVATAIWFRSRFIVVANFAIYVLIVLGYMIVKQSETGISIGFGIVALLSARLLNAQKHRLELKTELMRNAYLVSAFVVFPYALYHFVSARHVGLAWVGLALGYYGLSFLFRNKKYRWMGHGTLVGTMVYLVVVGSRQFEPGYRVASFLALGTVLLIVSLVFTRVRQRVKTPGDSQE